jgi:DNA-binding NtrC family response regulator
MLQVKLLRVLQEKQFERIGGTKTIISDFRILAATNKELEEEVVKGRFREDLYYRLTVIPIKVPCLRDRISDIPMMVDYFIEKFNRSKKKAITGISREAMSHLLHYPWPGNVRELENVVERMVLLSHGERIDCEDLPTRILKPEQRVEQSEQVAEFEKRLIIQSMEQTNWVKNRAAKLLNVNRTTLLEKMKRYGIEKED